MRRSLMIAGVALAAAGLAACEPGRKPVAGICKAFPAGDAQPVATDGAAVTEDCLHRWGYTLAGGADEAGVVAHAVVAACSGPLSRWNQQTLSAAAASDAPEQGQSLLTGATVTPIAQQAAFASDRALFYVVQARAGGCKPPPRRDGQPAMTAPAR